MRPPRGSVNDTAERSAPSVNGSACLTVQRPGAPCTVCRDACPAAAMTIQGHDIAIDFSACHGCGHCTAVCPTGAIASDAFATAQSYQHHHLEFECSRVPPDVVRRNARTVPCLGGLTVNRLLDFVAKGASTLTIVDRGWCTSCPAGGESEPWQVTQRTVSRLLEGVLSGTETSIRVERAHLSPERARSLEVLRPAAAPQLSRRQLFARLAKPSPPAEVQVSVVAASSHTSSHVTTVHLDERRQLLQSLSADRPLAAALFPSVDIAPTCCNSQVCTRACPTSALSVWAQPDTTGIAFDAALCIACGECEGACPTQSVALRAAGQGYYTGRNAVSRHARAICSSCDGAFTPNGDEVVCRACSKDRDLAALGFALMRRPQPQCAAGVLGEQHKPIPQQQS